ncbi:anti-sigma factor [Sutcliffiella horikoshii]|uniref:anti-sigma factor n=1 Tax=Sutcliffiella horikoshii TaxID=79883 RepID=UPI001CC18531|nr:anti-sigma factor [Sutcliffiella horikoshii]UAL46349.1 anti-sigma factor [Sutcliffiella horikoshii]
MNDDFKKKLERYDKDEMTPEEKIEFEKEMSAQEEQWMKPTLEKTKQRKILRASKWKARINTALTVIPLLLLIVMISSFLTNFYYYGFSDEYSRSQKLSDVINFSQVITDPYANKYTADTKVGMFLNMSATKELRKTVGKESYPIGEMEVNFLFSKMGIVDKKFYGKDDQLPEIHHPSLLSKHGIDSSSEWERLEMLPEGTVSTAFVTFDEVLSTEQVFELFKAKDLDVLWFPVVTSEEARDHYPISNIGFPNYPIFHSDDWKLISKTEEKSFLSSSSSETRAAPNYVEGDTEMLHTYFEKTLRFLADYQEEFDEIQQMHGNIQIKEALSYLEDHGISHHGVVITGPTKEVLSLKEEEWIGAIQVDEVALWNWSD